MSFVPRDNFIFFTEFLHSVYCLEFDSHKIVTGSRDKTIKIWDIQTGKLCATLRAHAGSVLCLKFDDKAHLSDPPNEFTQGCGFMVSGSSDCTVLVWDLRKLWRRAAKSKDSGPLDAGPELVKCVLRGHSGGVLDLRIDDQWILSWSVLFIFFQPEPSSNLPSPPL